MTHIDITTRSDWESWFAATGIDYVEVEACPDEWCEVCRAEPEVAAAA